MSPPPGYLRHRGISYSIPFYYYAAPNIALKWISYNFNTVTPLPCLGMVPTRMQTPSNPESLPSSITLSPIRTKTTEPGWEEGTCGWMIASEYYMHGTKTESKMSTQQINERVRMFVWVWQVLVQLKVAGTPCHKFHVGQVCIWWQMKERISSSILNNNVASSSDCPFMSVCLCVCVPRRQETVAVLLTAYIIFSFLFRFADNGIGLTLARYEPPLLNYCLYSHGLEKKSCKC